MQQKQQLHEAQIKNDEHNNAIAESKAQIVQLQKEKDDVTSSCMQLQQDMVHLSLIHI